MQKVCKQCSAPFEVTDDDLAFYDKVSPVFNGKKELIPPPTLCPDCRLQLRLSFRNLRNLSHRTCDLTGAAIISCYRASSPHTVYRSKEWWGDGWSGTDFGRDFDFNRPFFDQFLDLYRVVPVVHQYATNDIENCDYVNGVGNCKNCYLSFMMDFCEDCYYIGYAEHVRSSLDCLSITNCELCYECIDCRDSYHLLFSEHCIRCSDSAFLSGCVRCKNCIGCINLVDKEYYIFNKAYSREEFLQQKAILLDGRNLMQTSEQFRTWSLNAPHNYYFGSANEDFSGDNITHIKNSYSCFDGHDLENCSYCTYVFEADNCMDYHVYGSHSSWIYNCTATGGNCSNDLFCLCCWSGSSYNLYCHLINACTHCFGCSGLKNKKYCILNKQYSKEEYEELVPKIIAHMRSSGEWGEYFPIHLSAFGYNESEAQEYFPLTENEVVSRGWKWEKEDAIYEKYMGPAITIPPTIDTVDDSICAKILRCDVTGKPYKIIPQELKFYREMKLPIPRKCPDQRHKERMALRNPRKLWKRNCMKCQKEIETTYAPDRPEIIYCEDCYLSTVY